jgi:hypothetical protein
MNKLTIAYIDTNMTTFSTGFKKEHMPVEVYGIYDKISLTDENKHRLQEDLMKLFAVNDQVFI